MVQFYYNFVVPESTLQEVSGKVDIGFQVSTFLGFHWFLSVATVGKPVETKMTNYSHPPANDTLKNKKSILNSRTLPFVTKTA
jgi:hypothetical protein